MSRFEIEAMVREYKGIEKMVGELTGKMNSIEERIKREMVERDVPELVCSAGVVRFIDVLSTRFSGTFFKKIVGADVYKMFCREVASKRFTIA